MYKLGIIILLTQLITITHGGYYIDAHASAGLYDLSSETSNGYPVYARSDSAELGEKKEMSRYIFRYDNYWAIGRVIGGPFHFAECDKDNVFECPWFEYYVKAYASGGYYKLLSNETSWGWPVYTRGTTDPRYIYKYGNKWLIGKYIGGSGYFSTCDKDDLFECKWVTLCLTAYGSDGVYQRQTEIKNDKETYKRISGGDDRYIWWTGDEWWVSMWVGGGYFARCDQENIRDCINGINVDHCTAESFNTADVSPIPEGYGAFTWLEMSVGTSVTITLLINLLLIIFIFKCCKHKIMDKYYKSNNDKIGYDKGSLTGDVEEQDELL